MAEPRYAENNDTMACLDCGTVIADQAAHTRFHSILNGHAWALAVLKTAHVAAHLHGKYDVPEQIDSRQFDSWSGDALAEVLRDLPDDPAAS